MIILKSPDEIAIMRDANKVVVEVMDVMREMVQPGITTIELDRAAEETVLRNGAKPAFKGYLGYEHTLCTSINEEVVHGIPGNKELKEGDIISIDCGAFYKGFYGDHAVSFAVGDIDEKSKKLLKVCHESLYLGIEKAVAGNRIHDISAAIQEHAEKNGFSVVRDYVGHGIGTNLHEDPQVPNFGEKGTGPTIRPGLVIAIEPMLNMGGWQVDVLPDGWTLVTKDRKRSAHFEHSIAISEHGPEILSKAN